MVELIKTCDPRRFNFGHFLCSIIIPHSCFCWGKNWSSENVRDEWIISYCVGGEIFFENKGTAENGYVHYEIWGIGTSPHLYWRLKKVSYRTYLLFYYSFGDKKIAFKSPFNLYFNPFIIEFFFSKLKKRYRLRLLLMCLEALGERFALFSWEILQRGL